MIKEKEFYEKKLEESAETTIDLKDVHQSRLKQLGKQFKFGYGQKTADFNLLLKIMHDSDKFRKILNEFVNIYKYMQYLGRNEKIESYLKESGINIEALTVFNVIDESKQNMGKFKASCDEGEESKISADFLKDILDKGLEQLTSIEILKEDITVNAELVETTCDINKSVFKKSVALKTQKLAGKDISEKVASIERQSDQFSEVAELL